jgi:hypothetical protein
MEHVNSCLNVDVSLYNSCIDTTPQTTNLLKLLNTSSYKEAVESVRRITDKVKRDEEKKWLPAFTPSGVFEGRSAKGLIKHSRLIQFDIDSNLNKHIADFPQMKEQICKLPNIAYCALSVSGNGLWGLVPIEYPQEHRRHFIALEKAFKEFGITIDPSCKDVSRLRICSYDPNAYFNHQAIPFRKLSRQPRPHISRRKMKSDDELYEVEKLVYKVEDKQLDLTLTYQTWFEIACALANSFGESGREFFHRLSQFHPGYTQEDSNKQYDECMRHRYNYSIGTFFYYCEQAGIN